MRTRFETIWKTVIVLALMTSAASSLQGQSTIPPGVISIRLEQRLGNVTKIVPQNTVFGNGDVLRFQITSHVSGYLYVVDQGTTGKNNTLFPEANLGSPKDIHVVPDDNNVGNLRDGIRAGKSYALPANGDGWFEVSGPPGFDVLYFLVSATPISFPATPAGSQNPGTSGHTVPPPGMLPRCDDDIFKARGDCIDRSAGVTPLAAGAAVPQELAPLANSASRDIVLTDDGADTAVGPAAASKLPLVYTFRLAHR